MGHPVASEAIINVSNKIAAFMFSIRASKLTFTCPTTNVQLNYKKVFSIRLFP
jgi:hypothetical protein